MSYTVFIDESGDQGIMAGEEGKMEKKEMTPASVLDFWFSAKAVPQHFNCGPEFDKEIAERFLSHHECAIDGALAAWQATPEGTLALIVLLDQFSRNIFRDTPRAFAADTQACALADSAMKAGFDKLLTPEQSVFVYMPFMHSEDLATQEASVKLYADLGLRDNLKFATAHRDIIARFGRFPHRNAILKRQTTEAEAAFLQQPNSSF